MNRLQHFKPSLLLPVAIGLFLSACTPNIAYREVGPPEIIAEKIPCNNLANALEHIEKKDSDYYLGFVEVDDQGVFFDRKQFKNLTCELTEHAKSTGVLISVFVHGWHHNAAPGDENIDNFKKSLETLSFLEHLFAKGKGGMPRKTVGIFVGWRGESIHWPPFNYLTFWERKNTAEEIAARSISEALLNLEKIRNIQPLSLQANRLFIAGHSFGADVVYNALSPIMLERLINYEGTDCKLNKSLKGFGDFVFLINPAFESMQYINFLSIFSENKAYCDKQFPVFSILSSEQDEATKFAFPLGRKLSTLFETYRDIEVAGNREGDITVGQRSLDTTAIGHDEILFTHELIKKERVHSAKPEKDRFKLAQDDCIVVKDLRDGWVTEQEEYPLNDVILKNTKKYHPKTPYLVIKVDEALIPNHNEIYGVNVLNFMRRLVVMSTQEEVCAP